MLEAGVLPGVKLTILGLSPSASDVRMGQELRVIGRNFGIPALSVVTIGNATVDTFKAGSNSNFLIFNVPAVSGVPAAGKEVTLTVSGPTGFDSVQLFLRQCAADAAGRDAAGRSPGGPRRPGADGARQLPLHLLGAGDGEH
ncbi:MAG: IPT/TIG domain-containing protein [Comamonadaceae bacterium]|nr:IPT/TIG domain-containing protein [Comamonadaceae bacterium]